jgi:hypothetical protein
LKSWDFGRIGEWATGADDPEFNTKNISGAETFRICLICPILIAGTQVMLRKSFFFKEGKDEGFLDGLGVLLEC